MSEDLLVRQREVLFGGRVFRFIFDGYRVVHDVVSGATHVFDAAAWELLPALDPGQPPGRQTLREALQRLNLAPAPELHEAWEELQSLRRQGLLLPRADEEAVASRHQQERVPIIKSLCLHVAHACDLRCRYCFAGQGTYGGPRQLMSAATARKALDFLFRSSGPRRHLEVDFFGGEPLLNFGVVQDTVRYGREEGRRLGKIVKFTLTTNGTHLTPDVVAFLNKYDVAVVLSLDGRQEVHDRHRPGPLAGDGTYERVVPAMRALVLQRQGRWYYVRGTYCHDNLDFAADVAHYLELGFDQISMEPVVLAAGDPGYEELALRPEDFPAIEREYDRLAELYLQRARAGKPFRFFHFEMDMDNGLCLSKRLSGCGAGYEYLAVAPDGTFYPCHQFVGRPGFALGHVETGLERLDLSAQFRHNHVLAKPECRTCWARYLCSGGCHANNHAVNGDIHIPYELGCRIQRKRLECALGVQAVLAAEGAWQQHGKRPQEASGARDSA